MPFWTLDDVVLSPYRAGHARDTEALRMAALRTVLNTLARGARPEILVDAAAGY